MGTATYESTTSTPDDDWDMPSPRNDWDTFGDDLSSTPNEQETSSDSRLSRLGDRLTGLREGLVTSERQEAAKAFALSVGREAAIGAIQGSRLLEVDRETDDVRVRPARLVMGALRPGRTLRRAATGAVKGAKRGAVIGGIKGGAELAGGMRADGVGELTDTTGGYTTPEEGYSSGSSSEWD